MAFAVPAKNLIIMVIIIIIIVIIIIIIVIIAIIVVMILHITPAGAATRSEGSKMPQARALASNGRAIKSLGTQVLS